MGISFSDATGYFEHTLGLRARRAEVLANNLANADTPHYKARDIDFAAALQQRLRGEQRQQFSLNTTSDRHLEGSTMVALDDLLFRTPHQPSVDGNTVEEQVEHAAYMKNALAFQASFTFLNSKFKGLTSAIKGE